MRIRLACAAYAAMACALPAQGRPGTNITLTVTASIAIRGGDTVNVIYHLRNERTSAEQLRAFTVEMPVAPLSVDRPNGRALDWLVTTRYADRNVARWAILDSTTLAPGTSGPALSFTAIGSPGIVDAHVEGDYPPPPLREDSLASFEDPLTANAVHIRVVGVEAVDRSLAPAALVRRLQTLLSESCALGWVRTSGMCQSLKAKLETAIEAVDRGQSVPAGNVLRALRNELDAQRGKQLADNAYFLLYTNTQYILARL